MSAVVAFHRPSYSSVAGRTDLLRVTPGDSAGLARGRQWVCVDVAGLIKVTTNGWQTLTMPTHVAG